MAFFTRSKSTIPMLPGEEETYSEDEWDEELDERRTPDGRSSKTSYEVRRSQRSTDIRSTEPDTNSQTPSEVETITKDTTEPAHKEELAKNDEFSKGENEGKTDDDKFDFVVDRVLGVQV